MKWEIHLIIHPPHAHAWGYIMSPSARAEYKEAMVNKSYYQPRSNDFPKPAHHGAGFIKDEKDYENLKKYLSPESCISSPRPLHSGQAP